MKIGPVEISVHGNKREVAGPAEETPRRDYREIGGTGTTSYGSVIPGDYNPDLIGKRAIQTYDKMRKSDAKVRSSLRVVKAPLLAGEWYVEPASDEEADRYIAAFVEWAFNSTSRTFVQILQEALLMLDFGYYIFEKVFEFGEWDGKRIVKWKKFGPRHPGTIEGWEIDVHGGVHGVKQNREPLTGYDVVTIPIEKLLIFTLDEESNNPEGISVLRSAYKNWYYKDNLYKVDAIQKERHGLGIPAAELPMGYTQEDKNLANEMTANLRTNEKAKVVYPPGFKIGFLELKGQPVNALESAMHHDHQIALNVLAQFLDIGASQSGSRATSESHTDLFVKSIRYLSDLVRGVFNKWAIPELVRYNFNVENYPELKVRRIGDAADFRALSVALRNMKEAGFITPDSEFEKWWRDYMDLPIMSGDAEERGVDDRIAPPKASGNGAEPGNVAGNGKVDTNVAQRVPKPADGG